MSEMLNVFDAEFENTLPVPKSLDGLLNLSWLYQHVENFQKPSPDEQIDLQKKHGTRVPIIAKSSLKLPKSCYALLAVPAVKPKSEVKIEMPTINTPQ